MNADWIPASQPPRMMGRYLVTRKSLGFMVRSVAIGIYYPQTKTWTHVNLDPIQDVIGWMHAPEPMKEDEQ
jgi:hypothetical protein